MRLGDIGPTRWCLSVAIMAVLVSAVALTAQTSNAPPGTGAKKAYTVGHTAWGDPDLQGVWDFRTVTPLERPKELSTKAVLTEQEAAEFAARTIKSRDRET